MRALALQFRIVFHFQESPITGNGYSPSVVHRVAPASPRYSSKILIDNSTADFNVFATVDVAAQSVGSNMARQTVYPNKFRVFLGNSSSVAGSFSKTSASGSQSNQYLVSTTDNTPMVTIERNEFWSDFDVFLFLLKSLLGIDSLD